MSRFAAFHRRGLRWLVIAVAIAGIGGVAALTQRDAPDEPATMPPPVDHARGAALTVAAVRPAPVLWPDTLTASGAINPWQEAVVSSKVSGASLVEVLVDVGDQVEAGQLLARFDPAPLESACAEQQAALNEAIARLSEAEANASRARQLRGTQAISEFDLIKADTAAQAARAQVELARARLHGQQLALEHTRVTAPDAGVISVRSAMLGAVAGPGVELFRLVRQNRLEWHAEITAADLAAVRVGQQAHLYLGDGSEVTGSVRQIAPVVDSTSRTSIAYVALDPGTASVRAGMFASGKLLLGERVGLALPASAVVERDGYEYVFRLADGEPRRAMQVRVTSGRRLDGNVEILDGVAPQDDVVRSGGEFLRDGDIVRVVAGAAT